MNQKIPSQSRIDKSGLILGMTLLICGLIFLLISYSLKHSLLLIIGFGLGVSLYHAAFGFTGSWRNYIIEKKGNGIRSQLFAIALAILLILPFLDNESLFGSKIVGTFGPIGISVVIGSFLFGIGMQLGGGCGSGTLYTIGGGNSRMLITLIFFILGSLLGTLHLPWWLSLPSLGIISLSAYMGTIQTIIVQWIMLGFIAFITIYYEKRHNKEISKIYSKPDKSFISVFLQGSWPLLWGGIALALLSMANLFVAGHPWSVTFAFGLWGAKIATLLGFNVSLWEFWTWAYPSQALKQSILNDSVSLTNIGLIIGAFIASSLAGKVSSKINISLRSLLAAIIGGILMGYGARLAFGCSIGAFFSGIASGSLHGWLWFGFAFLGTYFGVKLRPSFGLN
ncbi:uncharacterized protein METZ01_LOCUS147984 [marine metagenome]|uniref:Uncharacterized protein n=1 Tax=marine metagenome TaxID=408172 RepID=A0A382A0U1_9ZZZZ